MTYKGSNWTRGELGHARPDPNPSIDCAGCGEGYPFQEYWKPRYVDPDGIDPHEEEWLCDQCKELERRESENRSVTEWSA